MSFGKDAFRDEDKKGATRPKPFSKGLKFKPTILADDWIDDPFHGRIRKGALLRKAAPYFLL